MKIVLLESLSVSKECMKKYTDILEQEGHSFQCYERNDDPEVQIQEIGDADIVMIANMPLSGKVISACPNLKFIDVAFTGVDHVDLQAAREKVEAVLFKMGMPANVKGFGYIVDGVLLLEEDSNLTSGESLIRQILYGEKFFNEEFGIKEQEILWLPDA